MIQPSSKIKFAAISLAILMFIGSFLAWRYFYPPLVLPAAEYFSKQKNMPSCTVTGSCEKNNIAASGNQADCAQLPAAEQAECQRQTALIFALKTLDLKVCDDLPAELDQVNCRASLIFKQAIIDKNATWCDKIEPTWQHEQCRLYFDEHVKVPRK